MLNEPWRIRRGARAKLSEHTAGNEAVYEECTCPRPKHSRTIRVVICKGDWAHSPGQKAYLRAAHWLTQVQLLRRKTQQKTGRWRIRARCPFGKDFRREELSLQLQEPKNLRRKEVKTDTHSAAQNTAQPTSRAKSSFSEVLWTYQIAGQSSNLQKNVLMFQQKS